MPQGQQIEQQRKAVRLADSTRQLALVNRLVIEKRRDYFVWVTHIALSQGSRPDSRIGMVRRVAIGMLSRSRNCSRARWMRDRTASGVSTHARAISS